MDIYQCFIRTQHWFTLLNSIFFKPSFSYTFSLIYNYRYTFLPYSNFSVQCSVMFCILGPRWIFSGSNKSSHSSWLTHCILHTAHFTAPCTAHCAEHCTAPCTAHFTAHCTAPCTAHCAEHCTAHCTTHCTAHYTLHPANCTHYKLLTAHCTTNTGLTQTNSLHITPLILRHCPKINHLIQCIGQQQWQIS